ncbi:MAG: hypothetical protein J6M93_03890 [Succinivibrio sp.]|nr:hypothetical protein [Succinivibrio sp.]
MVNVDTFGKPMFAVEFTNDLSPKDELREQFSLTQEQRGAIVDAFSIWGEIFAKGRRNNTYLSFAVTLDYLSGAYNNASASSDFVGGEDTAGGRS